jgi:pyridoxal 5'-phosphate synthase pdxS subunit
MAKAIVKATTHFEDPAILAEVSRGLGAPMRGIEVSAIPERELMAARGW